MKAGAYISQPIPHLEGGDLMEQESHEYSPPKDIFDDFMILRNSDYWPCLMPKTQKDILSLLDEHRCLNGEDK